MNDRVDYFFKTGKQETQSQFLKSPPYNPDDDLTLMTMPRMYFKGNHSKMVHQGRKFMFASYFLRAGKNFICFYHITFKSIFLVYKEFLEISP